MRGQLSIGDALERAVSSFVVDSSMLGEEGLACKVTQEQGDLGSSALDEMWQVTRRLREGAPAKHGSRGPPIWRFCVVAPR